MVNKKNSFVLGFVMILVVLGFSLVSASWFGKLTGQATSESVVMPACSDSDSGINPALAGKISLGDSTYEDKCITGDLLNELYCTKKGIQAVTYNCQRIGKYYGCIQGENGGACINLTAVVPENSLEIEFAPGLNRSAMNKSCHDSDRGMNKYIAGVLTGGSYGTVGYNHGPFKDYCSNDNSVEEYYCTSGDYVQVHTLFCSDGCRNGACKVATGMKKGFFARIFQR